MQEVSNKVQRIKLTEIREQRKLIEKKYKNFYVESISLDIRLEEEVVGDLSFCGFINLAKSQYDDVELHADLSGHCHHVKSIFEKDGTIKQALSTKIPKEVNNIYFGDGVFIDEKYRGKGYGREAMSSFINAYLKEGDVAVIWPFPVTDLYSTLSPSKHKNVLKKVQKAWRDVGFKPLRDDEEEPLYYLVK
jgi:GNAT superfamily N-acetyltransferase